ncbi:MAG TPA: hypothetical protein PLO60_10180, partial [Pseudomonadales bacterium]|nr:hypothetical protein [Pseudomonadales bacterium]
KRGQTTVYCPRFTCLINSREQKTVVCPRFPDASQGFAWARCALPTLQDSRRLPRSEGLHGDENILDDAFAWRWCNAILAQAIEMELYGGKQLGFGFLDGRAGSDAAGQIWRITGKIIAGLLDDNGVTHGFSLSVMPV